MARFYLYARRAIWFALAMLALLLAYALLRGRPQDLPWTPLKLGDPPGLFTGRKLAGLTGDAPQCRALLTKAGVDFTAMPAHGSGQCAYADGVRLDRESNAVSLSPAAVTTSCPVAAALKAWEWHVVQPAAVRILGQQVKTITHFGSYNCRRMYGRDSGPFSEHATADAIDISGFVLADGSSISVLKDWRGSGGKARFLHEVRDGGCRLFSTVLSPDYNAAHRDHLHMDQAERGALGWRACR